MLGKLLKYEIRATQRVFLPIFGLILICSLLLKTFIALNFQNSNSAATTVPFGITIFVYGLLIAAAFVMTLVVTIQRFQKNLLGDEGYLSFTLPVKVHSHIDCKMIVSVMWAILSFIVAFISIIIIVADESTRKGFSDFWRSVSEFFGSYGGWSTLLLVEGIVLFLVSCLSFVLHIYASISVGNFSSKHKLLASFGTFVGISVVEQIVTSLVINLDNFLKFSEWVSETWRKQNVTGIFQTVSASLGIIILFCVIFGAAFYFFTNWLLSKKLNLE